MDGLAKGGGDKALLGRLSDDHDWQQNIPNAWLASTPGHPFWMFCLMEIAKASSWLQCKGDECTRSSTFESEMESPYSLSKLSHYFLDGSGIFRALLVSGRCWVLDVSLIAVQRLHHRTNYWSLDAMALCALLPGICECKRGDIDSARA